MKPIKWIALDPTNKLAVLHIAKVGKVRVASIIRRIDGYTYRIALPGIIPFGEEYPTIEIAKDNVEKLIKEWFAETS